MYEFTELQLSQEEFNNLVFMGPPKEWKREECPELPFCEEHQFLFDLCLRPLKDVVKKVIEISQITGPNPDPTAVFENINVKARGEEIPWFEQHTRLSKHFHKELMGKLWIRNLTAYEGGERSQCPDGTFYIEDGCHRALVYAVRVACGEIYEPVSALHATSWDIASGILGHQCQHARELESDGKFQGRNRYYKNDFHMPIRLFGSH